jgi:hypothetical protein
MGAHTSVTAQRLKIGKDAGLSRQQIYQALAVARIPDEEFERLIESPNPPTVAKLAALGRRSRKPPRNTKVNLSISKEAVERLTAIAGACGLSRSAMIERLVLGASVPTEGPEVE